MHVVPYNRGLLVKYQAHINVERCNHSQSIKYLFKYIGEGPDAVMEHADGVSTVTGSSTSTLREKQLDEVKNYLSCRYVSYAEACWRIFEFFIHHREPYVQRLFFQLEDEQEVRFRDDDSLPEILGRIRPDGTMFVQWLLNNHRDESGHDLTFVRYPTRYRWDNAGKFWAQRKQNINVVGRMVYVHPASGERFYMHLLLNIIPGAQTFEEIRTVDGIIYPTYKEACFHRGLLKSDNDVVSNPSALWENHWTALADDIDYTQRKLLHLPMLVVADSDKQSLALQAINSLLNQHGKSMADFPGLPEINT
ncbi:uncharacterized protein LOC141714820 [Apium graveolens]|uniref:uncharacterized protein LOC141714820 n=1 Tax=Apium graveolens TaxID=4045 RepID=UPI003D798B75